VTPGYTCPVRQPDRRSVFWMNIYESVGERREWRDARETQDGMRTFLYMIPSDDETINTASRTRYRMLKVKRVKSKAISVTDRGGPWACFLSGSNSIYLTGQVRTGRGSLNGCKMLRILHFLDNRLTDGGKFFSALRACRRFTPQKHCFYASGTHFCYRLSEPQGLMRSEGLGKWIKIVHLIGYGSRDLQTCSVSP
jgi:hypothetical protein